MTVEDRNGGEKAPLLSKDSRSVSFSPTTSEAGEGVGVPLAKKTSSGSFLFQITDSERDLALQNEGVGPAALLIRDAVLGVVEHTEGAYDSYQHPDRPLRNSVSVVCRRLCALRPVRAFLKFCVWLLVILTFLEPPNWCRNFHPHESTSVDDDDTNLSLFDTGHCRVVLTLEGPAADDPTATVEYYPNSSTMFLTEKQSMCIESLCIFYVLAYVLLQIGRDGMSLFIYFRRGPAQLVRGMELLTVMALVVSLVSAITFDYAANRPFAPFYRVLVLIAFSRESQREIRTLFQLIPEVFNVLVILFVIMLFYAWFGVVLFYGTEEGETHFPSLLEGMWTLWICVTTANYPDVMMPAYNQNRLTTLYFISFMVITFFFLMNVILASVVNAYDNELDGRKLHRIAMVETNLKTAFQLLDARKTGSISRTTVMALFCILNDDFPELRRIENDEAKLLFALLDKDGTNMISSEEFRSFATVLLLEFNRESKTCMERFFPRTFRSGCYQAFSKAVRSSTFELLVDVMLVLNAIVVAIQSWPLLMGQNVDEDPHIADGYIDTIWEAIETLFTCVYVLEAFVKVLVFGWTKYSESYRNMFDFSITVLSVFATAYVYYPNEYSDSRLIRYVVMARVLRLARLLAALRPFQIITRISIEILPSAVNVLLLLFCIMYVFAAIGMEIYGGMITRNPEDPLAYLVLNTEFSDNEYWANNFNDMFSGMNVLFNLLVVNNWTECEEGFEAVTQSLWPRLFFLFFHVLGVILVNNLVVAFIINSFIQEWDIFQEDVKQVEVEGEAVIENRHATFDATRITGTRTEVSGRFIARIGRRALMGKGQQSLLRDLFTSSQSRDSHGVDDTVDSTN